MVDAYGSYRTQFGGTKESSGYRMTDLHHYHDVYQKFPHGVRARVPNEPFQ